MLIHIYESISVCAVAVVCANGGEPSMTMDAYEIRLMHSNGHIVDR